MNKQLEVIAAQQGLLVRRDLGELARAADWAVSIGELNPLLPGIYVPADQLIDWRVTALAACRYAADAVITGSAAAALTFWSRCRVDSVDVCHLGRGRSEHDAGGLLRWHRTGVPPQYVCVRGGLRFSAPAWTAVEMCGDGGARVIDEALRSGVQLEELWEALAAMRGRQGNAVRRRLLRDSCDRPWSEAEREAHRLLRASGVTGWRTNVKVNGYYLDVAWVKLRVCLEIDGFEYHRERASFEADRLRDQILVADGWVVLRITWSQLINDPASVMSRINRVLRRRARLAP